MTRYRVVRNATGHAWLISDGDQAILHVMPGTQINESFGGATRVVAMLNELDVLLKTRGAAGGALDLPPPRPAPPRDYTEEPNDDE